MTSLMLDNRNYEIPELVLKEWNYAIDKGMDWLDNHFGSTEWLDQINLARLELHCATSCVCGQLFDDQAGSEDCASGYDWWTQYVMEHEPWAKEMSDDDENSAFAAEVGFYLPREEEQHETENEIKALNGVRKDVWLNLWSLFTVQWVNRIQERREELA